jgi:hypothetical protein
VSSAYITRDKVSSIDAFAILAPPSWTRLEPVTTTGDPRPGLEQRVHDPLWFLARQWQLGEFAGEDAGTPLTVRAVTLTRRIDRWADASGTVRALDRTKCDLLEPLVEREPPLNGERAPGVRARVEAAAAFLAALDDHGYAAHRAGLVARCAMVFDSADQPAEESARLDPQWVRLRRLLEGRGVADAEAIAAALEAAAPALPGWLAPADNAERDTLQTICQKWLEWYRREISPPPDGADSWVDARLEYSFNVGVGAETFTAPAHRGGATDWHTFDPADGPLQFEGGAGDEPEVERRTQALLATPLRYGGMPIDRLWEMEDARVNLGLIESEPWDLGRLLVAEFALTYGNDWLVVPIDIPYGSLTTVESVLYTTAFGERFVVRPTAEASPDGRWQMFKNVSAAGLSSEGLLLPSGAISVQDGPPIEDVLFLRDEMANMCWAVERKVQGASGAARDRAREEPEPSPLAPGSVASAKLDYLLQTTVPARWIPYLPRRTSRRRTVDLMQGMMPGSGVPPKGRLLNSPKIRTLADAEIPREGVNVLRQPSVARRADGSYAQWITRRVIVGRGEGTSQLAFDSAISRKPGPRNNR